MAVSLLAGALLAGTVVAGAPIAASATSPSVTTSPSTSVLLPSSGATLAGNEFLDAGASDPAGVTRVEFRVTGGGLTDSLISESTPTYYGYIGAWNTTTVANGSYSIQSVAYDAAGNSTYSAPTQITVANKPAITTVLLPSGGATLSGGQYLDAGVSDELPVVKVEFQISGDGLSDVSISGSVRTYYGWIGGWSTTRVPNGSYTIQSVAYDAAGRVVVSPGVPVTVANSSLPAIRHVFVIALENEGYSSTFGSPANDPYLATTLPSEGALLENYYGTGHLSNDNYTALISGQPPNPANQVDCIGGFKDFPAADGQITWDQAQGIQLGSGCVYPPAVQTLAGQLAGKGLTWKGYMQDMGNDPVRDGAPTSTCGHPPVNGSDPTLSAESGDGYATRHDPFVYFHSIIDNSVECNANVVPLGTTSGAMPASDTTGATGLATDLKSIATTPNFSFISPNVCNDGHDYPCTNQTSPSSSAVGDIDSFLRTWVPIITSSPAFRQDGLLEITFDEAATSDSTACCNEMSGPSGSAPGLSGPGGGRVGTVLISPFITPGKVVSTPFNHYSSLASIEDLFGLPRLGDAQTVTSTFDASVYN